MQKICSSKAICSALALCLLPAILLAETDSTDSQDKDKKQTVEPVFRIPKIRNGQPPIKTPASNTPTTVWPQPFTPRPTTPPAAAQPSVDTARQLFNEVASSATSATPAQPTPTQPTPAFNATAPPVARVAMATEVAPIRDKQAFNITPDLTVAPTESVAHPLDRAIELANTGLENMRSHVNDYTAILVKRERVDNQLSDTSYMRLKIRNPRQRDIGQVPFSIYMKFIKPRGSAGREVIWVDGQNNNNLIAHETGALLRFKNFHLQPTGMLAMRGNRYPIYDAGIENLTLKLLEKAERDRAAGLCEVKYVEGAKIRDRACTLIEVKHKERKSPYEFHIAKVYIDDELKMPVRFASYDWPLPGQTPKLMEEYTYIKLKLNVGLTDNDFNIANPAYNFAK